MENRIPENDRSAQDKLQHTCRNINKITMVSININGIRGKRLELQAYLSTENPEIVALQETKIDSNIKSNELIPECLEYNIYRNDRTANGGGTMLLVKTYLKSAPLRKVENGSESTCAKSTYKANIITYKCRKLVQTTRCPN